MANVSIIVGHSRRPCGIVRMDNNTAMAVQSLLESQNVHESNQTIPVEEGDVFQCGKCKQKFKNLSVFFTHKQTQCDVVEPVPSSATGVPSTIASASTLSSLPAIVPSVSPSMSRVTNTNVIYTAQFATPHSNRQQLSLPANAYMLPVQSFSPRMLITDDLISFHPINNAATVHTLNGASPFVPLSEAAVSSTNDGSQPVTQDDSSPQPLTVTAAAEFIPSSTATYQPMTDSRLLQPRGDNIGSAVPRLSSAVSVDLINRLNKRVMLPLPTIQAIQLPLDQTVPRLPLQVSQGVPLQVNECPRVNQVGGRGALSDGRSTLAFLADTSEPVMQVAGVEMASGRPPMTSGRLQYRLKPSAATASDLASSRPPMASGRLQHRLKPSAATASDLASSRPPMASGRPQHRAKPSIAEASITSHVLYCTYCHKSFTKNFDLQQHTRSHTGVKPFQCIVCGRAFAQKSNVKKHLQTHKVWPLGMNKTLPDHPAVVETFVISTSEPESTSSVGVASPPVTKPVSSNTQSLSSATTLTRADGSEVYIEVDQHAMTSQSTETHDSTSGSSIHVVVDNKTSASQVVRTMIRINAPGTGSGMTESTADKLDIVVDNSYVCQYCAIKFDNYFQLKSHMVIHKDEQVYKCVVKSCSASFQELEAFLDHIRRHDNEMSYRCHQCNRQFQSLSDLGMHQYSHSLYPNKGSKTGPKYFRCNNCNNKYATPEALQHHLETSSHVYNCPNCCKVFTCERYLRRHLPTHGTVMNYICSVCMKTFKTEQYLKIHMVTHSNAKPFHCHLCNSSFNRKDKLKRHLLIHDPVKRYKCPLRSRTGCTKEFNRADKLKAHIIAHAGAKPHRCQTCGRMFTRRPHLRVHERCHDEKCRYRCLSCNEGFVKQTELTKHRCTGDMSAVPLSTSTERRRVGRPRKNMLSLQPLPPTASHEMVVKRPGRPSTTRGSEKVLETPGDKTSSSDDKQEVLNANVMTSVESSHIVSSVDTSAAVDSGDTVDIATDGTVAVGALDNGTLYLLQPLESQASQSIACRTLQLLTSDSQEAGSTPGAVLVATSAADVISGSAELAYFLHSADIKHEPSSTATSHTPSSN